MSDNDFLVTLPSNSNMREYPDNEPAKYTVQLATPITLHGEWEAALVSMQYTHTWLNLNKDLRLRFMVEEWPTDRQQPYHEVIHFAPGSTLQVGGVLEEHARAICRQFEAVRNLPSDVELRAAYLLPTYFANAQAVGDEVCRQFALAYPNTRVKLRYVYNHVSHRGRFLVSNGDVAILSPGRRLGKMLGHSMNWMNCKFCEIDTVSPGHTHWYMLHMYADTSPEIRRVSSLWVYSDITQNQLVGNTKVPLLGIVPTDANVGERCHYCVNPVHFLGLTRTDIRGITVQIMTDRGERVPFAKGDDDDNVVCCLRFRRRKSAMPI